MRSVGEWIGKNDDANPTDTVRMRIYTKQNGKCPLCGRPLRKGHWDVDHIRALINGGENRESNLQAVCDDPCHTQKTRLDVAEKAKNARVRARHLGIKKPRTITRWRKFNGEIVIADRSR